MLKQPGKDPKIRGKAAETRRMCYCVDFILSDILQPRNDHERQVAQCVKAFTTFYREMEDWNPESSTVQARKFGRPHILLYIELYRAGQASRAFFFPRNSLIPRLQVLSETPHVHPPGGNRYPELWEPKRGVVLRR